MRASKPQQLPVVLTRQEVQRVIAELHGSMGLAAQLMSGAGIRVMECVDLRVKDIDLDGREIRVEDGKGRKDRVTVLPAAAVEALHGHLKQVRHVHVRDLERGAGWVALPDALGRKYPTAGREWGWQWIFPATRTYVDPRSGQRRRHQLHETVVQRAIKDAVKRAGIPKPATSHTLRWAPVVAALQALRGVSFVTAVGLVAEIGDLRRFPHPRELMAYLGLVPSEYSSGPNVRRCAITKAGNPHARRLLAEAA